MFLIIDCSTLEGDEREDALQWLSRGFIGRVLQNGDTLSLWAAGEKARLVYTGTLGPGSKEEIQGILRDLPAGEKGPADFPGALREAAAGDAAPAVGEMTFTLLISGSSQALASSLSGGAQSLLRYSRVEEFKGWRALVVAFGIDGRVKRAAKAYMDGGR